MHIMFFINYTVENQAEEFEGFESCHGWKMLQFFQTFLKLTSDFLVSLNSFSSSQEWDLREEILRINLDYRKAYKADLPPAAIV